jgi:flagellar biosynthesis protein FlhF
MLLKTYRAPDLSSALAQAREEMGPDALVLGTKEISGRLGLRAVEVTVGAKRREPARPDPTRHQVDRSLEAGPSRIEPAVRRDAPWIAAALEALLASGVSPDLAARFARIASADLTRGAAGRAESSLLASATVRGMEALVSFAPLPSDARCVFVVGPPGCGKTTTAAKLAARTALSTRRRVFFAEADVEKVGSLEQAEIFARHMEAELARVDEPDDLLRAVADAGREGFVVVDTPGIASADIARRDRLSALRESMPEAPVVLLLPAGLCRDQAARALDAFASLRPTCVALSRVDDGERLGELVSAVAPTPLPLAFVTNGHRVPDDLASASAGSLALLLLRGGRRAAPEEARP